jgi:hypothetical protein
VAITWTMTGELGLVLAAANLRDSIRDWQRLIELGIDGSARLVTRAAIRQDAIRTAQMLGVFIVGLVALFAAPTITAAQRRRLHIPTWTTTSVALSLVLAGIVLGLIVNAYLDRRVRHHFYEHDDGE